MAQTRLKSGNLHMIGGDNGSDGNVLKSKGDGTMEWGTIIINPTFSSFDYPGDDTALDPAGGQSLVINGTGFNPSLTVTIGGTTCSSITRNSSEQLTVTTPAKSAGSQAVVITNTDGGSASTNVSYNGIPAFTNAAGSLGSVKEGESINFSAAATEPDGGAITYAITSGALPSGVTLNASTGAITGTAPSVSADTTSNFTVTATDDENQSTARAYSITVTPELPSDNFNTVLYTGNGSTQSITGVGFQPDFVWIKVRSAAGYNHVVFDSTRGATKRIYPNDTAAENSSGQLSSFDSDGFSFSGGGSSNVSGQNMVAWCWKATGGTTSAGSGTGGVSSVTHQVNNDAGFSIINFTEGTGTSSSVNHGLDATPDLIITRRRTMGGAWMVWHNALSGSQYLRLNENNAVASSTNVWNGTAPNATSVSLGPWLTESDDYGPQTRIMYAFHSVAGYSKFGSYTGNGSTNGPIVETGFEPAFVMFKRTDIADNWILLDNKRSTSNPRINALFPNLDAAELTSGFSTDFLTNGFQLKTSDGSMNSNGGTYIYMAFAADPDTTAPTLADSFSTVTYTGNNTSQSISGLGFQPNLVWIKDRSATRDHNLTDSVRGVTHPIYIGTGAQLTNSTFLTSFDTDGFSLGNQATSNQLGDNFVAWAWKADDNEPTINTDGSIDSIVSANANAGFSIVKWNGGGSTGTIGHGLSATPEIIMVKHLNGANDWWVYNKDLNGGTNPASYILRLNGSDAEILNSSGSLFQGTSPTSTVFTGGSSLTTNGREMIAYCFHSVSNYSKIGSYTGTGSAGLTVTTGFQVDFLMIKGIDSGSDNWFIFDSVRGDGAGLHPNLSNAEFNNTNGYSITFNSTSFTLNFSGTTTQLNTNGNNYIYMAIKIN